MKRAVLLVLVLLLAILATGCSTVLVIMGPSHKDLEVLNPGTSRLSVAKELGAPILAQQPLTPEVKKEIFSSEVETTGQYWDAYSFVQGSSVLSKSLRATGYIITDLCTLFAAEIFWIPTETIVWNTREEMTYKVAFNNQNLVVKAKRVIQPEAEKPKAQATSPP